MPSKPYMLSPRETFEKYERRSPVLAHSQYPEASFVVEPPTLVQTPNQFIVTEYPNFEEKRKIPYPWIIGVAICVPVFIMIVLFLAIWLQELGWI
ncbi:hypothetical protein M3Y97_00426500 [Aphelenchoides bicaudatus]|nr:hypothetical protein M3Y97_00426500 [Aphelenchoides bicaudatus]